MRRLSHRLRTNIAQFSLFLNTFLLLCSSCHNGSQDEFAEQIGECLLFLCVLRNPQENMHRLTDVVLFTVGLQYPALLLGQIVAGDPNSKQKAGRYIQRDADGGENIRVRAVEPRLP